MKTCSEFSEKTRCKVETNRCVKGAAFVALPFSLKLRTVPNLKLLWICGDLALYRQRVRDPDTASE